MNPLSNSLSHVARLHRNRAATLLSDLGLYPGQERVLKLLTENTITMSGLAAALQVTNPTVTTMVGRMMKAGLVRRSDDETDGRKVWVHLTQEGWRRAKRLDEVMQALEEQTFGHLDAADRERLGVLLGQLRGSLDPVEAEADEMEVA